VIVRGQGEGRGRSRVRPFLPRTARRIGGRPHGAGRRPLSRRRRRPVVAPGGGESRFAARWAAGGATAPHHHARGESRQGARRDEAGRRSHRESHRPAVHSTETGGVSPTDASGDRTAPHHGTAALARQGGGDLGARGGPVARRLSGAGPVVAPGGDGWLSHGDWPGCDRPASSQAARGGARGQSSPDRRRLGRGRQGGIS
jgi:hypothetical protein